METVCLVEGELMTLKTDERMKLVDITPRIAARVRRSAVRDGIALVSSMHTTLALFVNEYQDALLEDVRAFLELLAPRGAGWRHDDPRYSDCERRNADAHLRAALLGHALTLPVRDGELALGTFQSVIAVELDGPRARALHVQILGS
jgi:secondary thiamine-phosphate synthase enzyme